MPRADDLDGVDGADRSAAAGGPRGDRRLVVAGGVALLAALLGYLAVRTLVAAGTLPGRSEVLALPVFGLLGVTGFVLFVASFLTE
ncbi:hypothetical protein [Halobaculum sp. EA56]|uniref:hypothetical protein n=1 Tax=Halobaculum sp. EA56 TaxID=3421648 RepID=UPI003EBDACD9